MSFKNLAALNTVVELITYSIDFPLSYITSIITK